jgi:hypothetical protein
MCRLRFRIDGLSSTLPCSGASFRSFSLASGTLWSGLSGTCWESVTSLAPSVVQIACLHSLATSDVRMRWRAAWTNARLAFTIFFLEPGGSGVRVSSVFAR